MTHITIHRLDIETGEECPFTEADIAAISKTLTRVPISPDVLSRYLHTREDCYGCFDLVAMKVRQNRQPTLKIVVSAHPRVQPENLTAAVQVAKNMERTENGASHNKPYGVRWYFHVHAVLTVLLGLELANQLQPFVHFITWEE